MLLDGLVKVAASKVRQSVNNDAMIGATGSGKREGSQVSGGACWEAKARLTNEGGTWRQVGSGVFESRTSSETVKERTATHG